MQIETASDFTPVKDINDAKHIARTWAMENDIDLGKAVAFADEWYETTASDYRARSNLLWMLSNFHKFRQRRETAWERQFSLIWQEATQWDIETVRHLAAFNGAGLAGSAALLAASARFADAISVKIALLGFSLGLILAVLNLWLNTQGHIRTLKHTIRQHRMSIDAATWEHLKAADSETAANGDKWHSVAVCIGWVSAICGIVSGVLIGIALF